MIERIESTHYTTQQFADFLGIKRGAINRSRSQSTDGSYMGIIPLKLPNGRVWWEKSKVDALLKGE